MLNRKNQQIRHVAAAAIAAALVHVPVTSVLAQGSPGAEPAGGAGAGGATVPARETIERASDLLIEGNLVRARALLQGLLRPSSRATLTDAERDRAFDMLGSVNRKLNSADPIEVSLQKSDLALGEGDLRLAERHADAVLKAGLVKPPQAERAKALLAAAGARRSEMAPSAPGVIERAALDFKAGRYAESKAGLDAVYRAGVGLTGEQQAMLDQYQARIVDLERSTGTMFDTGTVTLGMLQPGVVQRRDQEGQPAEQPPVEPAPDAEEQPIDQPPPPPPAEDDLVQSALRFEAQSVLAEADRAFDERRLNEASDKYARLRDEYRQYLSAEQIQHVEERLAETRILLGETVGPRDGDLPGVVRDLALIKAQTLAQFNNDMEQARRAVETGNTTTARDLVARARLSLTARRDAFAENEFENLLAETDTLLAQIGATEEQIRNRTAEERERDLAADARAAQERQQQEREQKINELIDRARAYQQELRYDEALQAVDQLLFLDPINPAGLLLRDVLYDISIYRRFNDIQDEKQRGMADQTIDNQEAIIPSRGLINYPNDWPALSYRRGEPVAYAEPAENRRVLAELNTRRIPSVNFTDNSLRDVIGFIETITQLNIDVDWDSLREIPVDPETTVSLRLTNVPVRTVLDRVLEKVGTSQFGRVGWAVNDGVLTIASEDALRKNTDLVLYDIRDLLIEVPDYEDAPEIDLQQAISASQGGGGGQSPFNQNEEEENEQDAEDRRQERTQQIIDILQQNIDFEGWRDNGGETGFIQQLNGNLIITNTGNNHRAIAGLLSRLREVRAMQINVETRFLLVNQDFFEQIGFDLDVYLNANNNQVRFAQQIDPSVQGSDFLQFNPNQLPPGQQQIGPRRDVTGAQRILDLDNNGIPEAPIIQGVRNPRPWSPIGFNQNSLGLAQGLTPNTGIAGDILGRAPALGIAGQFLDDIQVDFLVTATQADRRSISLTAPRLTFTNGQTSNIYVVTQQSFISDLQPIVADSAVGFDPTVGVVSEGVTLLVEGTVSADRRYVTMNVDAGVARIDGFGQQAVTAVAGGQLVNSAQAQSFIQLPTVTVTRVRSTVTVPDQGTILMGGQRLITELEVETGVPVLSKIPVINRFFTNRIESKEEQTLLILIKPTILIQNEEEERNFPGLLDNIQAGFGG